MWHGLSHSLLLFVSWFVFSLYCVHVFGFRARSMAPLSFRNFFFFFFFFFIYCVHAFEFTARNIAPLSFGSFSFICWLFFLLFSYIVYMLIKTNVTTSVIQWLASSGRLVLRKNWCNLNGVWIKHAVSKTTCWDFGPKCWELKFFT